MAVKPVKTHPYTPDTHYDWRGVPYCTCGSRKGGRIHQLKEQDPQVTKYEQRKVGER